MIEAQYKTGDNRITFRLSAPNVKEMFLAIADLQGVFEAETYCRICNSPNPKFVVQPVEKGEYYRLRCANPGCGAQFDFGQLSDGSNGLFPKRERKDKEGNVLPSNGGWYHYQPKDSRAAPAPPASSAPPSRSSSGPPPHAPDDSSHW